MLAALVLPGDNVMNELEIEIAYNTCAYAALQTEILVHQTLVVTYNLSSLNTSMSNT